MYGDRSPYHELFATHIHEDIYDVEVITAQLSLWELIGEFPGYRGNLFDALQLARTSCRTHSRIASYSVRNDTHVVNALDKSKQAWC